MPLPIACCAAAVLLLFAAAGQGPPSDEEICSSYRASREDGLAEVLLSRYRAKLRRLAARLIFAESAPPDHLEDVEAEMRLALVAAMIGYEACRGATFHTYLLLVAEHAGRDFLRREARHGAHALCSLDGLPSEDERGSYLAREARAVCRQAERDQDPVRHVLLAETYTGLLGALTEGERRILRVIADGGSEGDVARRLACSRDAARVGRCRMLRKAQVHLKKVSPPL